MTAYSTFDHNAAFLAAVKRICATLTAPDRPNGVSVGDGGADSSGSDPKLPYCIVYPLGSSKFDGPTSTDGLDADAWPTTQVTYNGETREQADWLRSQVRAQLLGSRLVVNGRSVGPIRLHMELPSSKDTSAPPYIYWAVDHYRVFSTPV